jgi:hypothetical protein
VALWGVSAIARTFLNTSREGLRSIRGQTTWRSSRLIFLLSHTGSPCFGWFYAIEHPNFTGLRAFCDCETSQYDLGFWFSLTRPRTGRVRAFNESVLRRMVERQMETHLFISARIYWTKRSGSTWGASVGHISMGSELKQGVLVRIEVRPLSL